MKNSEFSERFDLFYNNITSNQAPGLNEWEKSVFLTQGEKEVVKNHFLPTSKGNTTGQGFDDSAKRQADFSMLMKTATCSQPMELVTYTCTDGTSTKVLVGDDAPVFYNVLNNPSGTKSILESGTYDVVESGGEKTIRVGTQLSSGITTYTVYKVVGFPYSSGSITIAKETLSFSDSKIDDRSTVYVFPPDVFIMINESIKTSNGNRLQVIPLRYDDYTRQMSKPFKRPLKNQAWRLMNSGVMSSGTPVRYAEIITNESDKNIDAYNVRYVRMPKPIILTDLTADGLYIDGEQAPRECELDPILHEEVLQRAVELAKAAWQGDVNTTTQIGQRSE